MTFKITIERAPIGVEFEVGSISEAIAILEQEDTNLRRVVSIGDSLSGASEQEQPEANGATGAEPAKRGRKPNKDKSQPDAANAQAPAPLPIPPGAAPPTVPADLVKQNAEAAAGGGIPDYLKAAPAAAAPPPPPPPPAPAPVPAPPSGILAGKVIADLDKRKATTADEGKALVEWLAAYGLVNAGSSYDESVAAIRLMHDDKLGQVATALSVA